MYDMQLFLKLLTQVCSFLQNLWSNPLPLKVGGESLRGSPFKLKWMPRNSGYERFIQCCACTVGWNRCLVLASPLRFVSVQFKVSVVGNGEEFAWTSPRSKVSSASGMPGRATCDPPYQVGVLDVRLLEETRIAPSIWRRSSSQCNYSLHILLITFFMRWNRPYTSLNR